MKFIKVAWISPILFSFFVFLPLFATPYFEIIDVSQSGFANILKNSNVLSALYSGSVGTVFPIIIELAMDPWMGTVTIDIMERISMLISLIIPSLIFSGMQSSAILPNIFFAIRSVQMIVRSYACFSVLSKLAPSYFPMHKILPVFVVFATSLVLRQLTIFNPSLTWPLQAFYFLSYSSWGVYTIMLAIWAKDTFSKYASKFTRQQIGTTDYMIVVYGFIPILHLIVYGIAQSVCHVRTFIDAPLPFLVTLQVADAISIVLLCCLPYQLAKVSAARNSHALALKRSFVRYVSHEIRSPLNVVSAGLDVLGKQITKENVSPEFAETVSDVTDSTAAAITILDDLLHYESMDAGVFKLELEEKSVCKAFSSNLNPLRIFARSRAVKLDIIRLITTQDHHRFEQRDERANSPAVASTIFFGSNVFVRIESGRLDQVLRNLITNAIKFSPKSGGIVTVTIQASRDVSEVDTNCSQTTKAKVVGSLRVDVTDNGAGIAVENQGKVFGEFSQFDRNNLQGGGGSGLGLWISRNIMLMHGGTLGFHSEGLGKGCTFYLCLPLYEPLEGDANAVVERSWFTNRSKVQPIEPPASVHSKPELPEFDPIIEESAKSTTAPALVGDIEMGLTDKPARSDFSLKILIVDDSLTNRKIVTRVIMCEPELIRDPKLFEADDGDVAVELVKESIDNSIPFDLVLMDSTMNNMHGPEAVRRLRQDLNFTGKIVGLTGNAHPEDIAVLIAAGCDHVLVKPLQVQKLFDYLTLIGMI